MLRQLLLRSLFLPLLIVGSNASAQLYRLSAGSSYLEGCLSGLCLCPVRLQTEIDGDMRLERAGLGEFKVFDVRWEVRSDAELLRFSGEGRYLRRVVGFAQEQRMELALRLNGREAVPYDSGWLPIVAAGDEIDVYLPMAEIVCYGSAFELRAVAASTVSSRVESWSTVKARW